jgi:hypothetical protein
MYHVRLVPSPHRTRKLRAEILDSRTGRVRSVDFGQRGASDYTLHKDDARMVRYLVRHHAVFRSNDLITARSEIEDWGLSGIYTAGFWSRWILWSATSISAAKRLVHSTFPDIRFVS